MGLFSELLLDVLGGAVLEMRPLFKGCIPWGIMTSRTKNGVIEKEETEEECRGAYIGNRVSK